MNLKALAEYKKAILITIAIIAIIFLYPDQSEQLFDGVGEVFDASESIIVHLLHLFLYVLTAGLVIAAIIFSYIGIMALYKRFEEGDSAVRLEIKDSVFQYLGLIAFFWFMFAGIDWMVNAWNISRVWAEIIYGSLIVAYIWYQYRRVPR